MALEAETDADADADAEADPERRWVGRQQSDRPIDHSTYLDGRGNNRGREAGKDSKLGEHDYSLGGTMRCRGKDCWGETLESCPS
jgi:hypothetical protein